ncbi:MAG TPA: radical SAM protein [Methanotrichaceae archaeon]|nr:radical SAM protein [Methanotrichaceae archaeon]
MERSPSIILTADETMMSRYRGSMFLGFSTCSPRGILPGWLYFMTFAPPVPRMNGRAMYSDFGLRIIEASLLADGFGEDEVAVVHPRDLRMMVGDDTEIIGITGHDFLGINPPTSTFVDVIRTGPPYNRVKFLELLRKPVMRKATVVVGGKGAWEVADIDLMDKLGIDHVHLGEGELSVPRMFRSIIRGEEVPRIVTGEDVPVEMIPNIRGPSTHGLVEISRGCRRRCSFCTPGTLEVRHKSVDHIVRDVQVNISAGAKHAILHSEDVLLYGARGIKPDEDKVMDLFRRVTAISGVTNIAASHIALATAYHSQDLVRSLSDLWSSLPDQVFNAAQTGIETASVRLMEKHMKGKTLPAPAEKWPEVVSQSLGLLHNQHWILACTLIMDLPGEEEADVLATRELMDEIKDLRMFYVPMGFVSMGPSSLSKEKSFTVEKMTPLHWMLMGECVDHDVKIARGLSHLMIEKNLLMNIMGTCAMNRFIDGAQGAVKAMKAGNPPKDYSNSRSYLIPEI